MAVERSDEPLDVIWVFRPLGMETWFLLEQRNCCSPKNKHVDGIRCDIVYAYPAIDGVVRWKIDGRFVTPKQLVKLETARTQEEKIRIAGVLIDTAEVKSRGHTVVRELLSVYDQPKLQVRKCLTNSDETVKLVAIGLRQPPPIESEAEVIIHPIADHEFRLKRSRSPPEVFIKAEVTEPNENQDPRTDQKADQTPNQEMPGNSTPPRKKRRNKLQAGEESPKRKIYSLRRRKPS